MAKFNSCVSLLEGIQVSNGHGPMALVFQIPSPTSSAHPHPDTKP